MISSWFASTKSSTSPFASSSSSTSPSSSASAPAPAGGGAYSNNTGSSMAADPPRTPMTAGRDTKVLLVLNPNSSKVITEALRQNLDPLTPPGTALEYMTGPLDSPESINDAPTSVLSAAATFKALQPIDALPYSGFLICCFSDHPLVGMLRHMVPNIPCIGIFEASILHALICGTKFGILTTGRDAVPGIDAGVRALLGGNSDRYAGTVASGLGVVELQTGERKIVERRIKESAAKVAAKGADVIILGCAGMSGMETLVKEGVAESGARPVAVIDGAKAGIEVLAGLSRTKYRQLGL